MPFELQKLLKEKVLIFDGAMGTELYARHVFTNRSYDEICLSAPALVLEIHHDYVKAGADVITTNSFGANAVNLKQFGLAGKAYDIAKASAGLARKEADSCKSRKVYVAGSLGPIPSFGVQREERIAALKVQAQALIDGGVDFLLFETLPNREAAEVASIVMKELGNGFPFVLSHSVPEDLSTELLEQRFAPIADMPQPQAIGLNCGAGPDTMLTVLENMIKLVSLPVIVQPNVGVPRMLDGRQLYLCSPEYLYTYAIRYTQLGARAVGGCCGTTPAHIVELARAVKPLANAKSVVVVSEDKHETQAEVTEKPLAERSKLGKKLANHEWINMIEITPPPSWNTDRILANAKLCKEHGVDTLNIPDGPRASIKLSALVTAMILEKDAGMETVLHICARDRNMIALQSDMLGAAACGLRNFLMITGDPPKLGNYSFASGVFDTDSIGLVKIQKNLNHGIDLGGMPIKPATEAVVGVGADPNAVDFEREVRRIREKTAAGADYITTQPVFATESLFRFMDAIADLNMPVIAGIWPLVSLRNALFMRNEVPGVVVPDEIMARMEAQQTGEEQLAEGIAIAQETLAKMRSRIAGVQVSAPFGKVQIAMDIMGL